MNELLKSKVFEDFKNGKLPEVQVSVTPNNLAYISLSLIATFVVCLFLYKASK